LSTQRELNVCLQDVAVTQEVFTQHTSELTGQLSKLEAKNQALEKKIEDLK
jgi:cell division protein FtsB